MNQDEYLDFLIDYVGSANGEFSYNRLLSVLYNIEYYFLMDMDSNQRNNAVYLKKSLADENGIRCCALNYCSVLDILIYLADHMAFDIDPLDCQLTGIDIYFWELIENLGLSEFSDQEWVDRSSDNAVKFIIDRWLNRKFKRNGIGSPFPLSSKRFGDQRYLELWDQMNCYIFENY